MKLTLDESVAATGAQVLDGDAAPAQLDVVTDTRTIAAGDTFVALRGDLFAIHAKTILRHG